MQLRNATPLQLVGQNKTQLPPKLNCGLRGEIGNLRLLFPTFDPDLGNQYCSYFCYRSLFCYHLQRFPLGPGPALMRFYFYFLPQ